MAEEAARWIMGEGFWLWLWVWWWGASLLAYTTDLGARARAFPLYALEEHRGWILGSALFSMLGPLSLALALVLRGATADLDPRYVYRLDQQRLYITKAGAARLTFNAHVEILGEIPRALWPPTMVEAARLCGELVFRVGAE